MDKSALRAAVVRQLEADLALQTTAALTSRDEATHEESKAENRYDMHAQEAAYLAEGQARLVAELRANIAQVASMPLAPFGASDPIAVGALVTLTDAEGGSSQLLIGPRAGGVEVEIDGAHILVVTPASPLGRQLLGRRAGDSVPSQGRGGPQRIARVS